MAQRERKNKRTMGERKAQPEQPDWIWKFNTAWILVPLVLLGMAYVLRNSRSSVTWGGVMDMLNVVHRDRFTMLFHLGLIAVFIVAAVRILGRKDK